MLKNGTATNELLPIEIHVALCPFGLWASGDAQTPTELLSPVDIHRCRNTVFKITNSNKGTAAGRDKCDTVWASGDAQTHTLAPAE